MDLRARWILLQHRPGAMYIYSRQYSEGSLLSSLVIPTTRQPVKSFAEVSKLRVPFQRAVATTLSQIQQYIIYYLTSTLFLLSSNHLLIQGPNSTFLINLAEFQITTFIISNNLKYVQQQNIIRLILIYLRMLVTLYSFLV